jgi:glyoxylate/hydroxypyruvate reductase
MHTALHGRSTKRPVLLFACVGVNLGAWRSAFQALPSDIELRFWPDAGDLGEIDYAFVWGNPSGFMRQFPNLKAVFSLGAGADALLRDTDFPAGVPIVRMLEPEMSTEMSDFVSTWTAYYHRSMHEYAVAQRDGVWRPIRPPLKAQRTVGIMGLGELGARCAADLAAAGYAVRGWSRKRKKLEKIECFAGKEELGAFLDQTQILICILPLTPETENILCKQIFDQLPSSACLINVGRGGHLVEEDLLSALADGRLAGAVLDVFRTEPLPQDHPFWRHSRINVIPHAAAFTHPETAVQSLAENLRRTMSGAPMIGVVDRTLGY